MGAVTWPVAEELEELVHWQLSRIHVVDESSIPGWEATKTLNPSKKSFGGCSL